MLEIKNVNASYNGAQILYNVSLKVGREEIVSVIGANGAGKTTLAKVISGLLRPSSGSIMFMGEDITKCSPSEIYDRGLVHIPEGRKLFPLLKVRENLELGAYTHRARKKLKESLKEVYRIFPILKERENQIAGTLSGGELQQLAIGRGLMGDPRMLIMDEPTLGLAPKLVKQTFEHLRAINEEKKLPILLISQEVYRSLQLSNRCYVLENGRVVLEGKSKKVLGNRRVKEAYLGL